MTQDDVIADLRERVAWLERKMVRVLWLLISMTAGFVGWVVAYSIDRSFGWPSIIIGLGVWICGGLALQRSEFKGAPKHIEFINP